MADIRTKEEVVSVAPVGTLAELKILSMDLRTHGSCSRRVLNNGVIVSLGCESYDACMGERFLDKYREVAGPEKVVYRQVKPNMMIIEREADCFAAMQIKNASEGQGQDFEIIGGPGAHWTMGGSKRAAQIRAQEWVKEAQEAHDSTKDDPKFKPKKFTINDVPPELRSAAYASMDAKSSDPYQETELEQVCSKFPRPDKNPKLFKSNMAKKHRDRMADEVKRERKVRAAGLSIEELEEDSEPTSAAG